MVEVLNIEINISFFEVCFSLQKIAKTFTITSTVLLQDFLLQHETQKFAGYFSYCYKMVQLN